MGGGGYGMEKLHTSIILISFKGPFLKVLLAYWAQKTIFCTRCLSTRITCLLCSKAVYNLDDSCKKHWAILQEKFSPNYWQKWIKKKNSSRSGPVQIWNVSGRFQLKSIPRKILKVYLVFCTGSFCVVRFENPTIP